MSITELEEAVNGWDEGNLYFPTHLAESLQNAYEDSLLESASE